MIREMQSTVSHATIDRMWARAVQYLLHDGLPSDSRDGETLETLAYTATLRHPEHSFLWNPGRKLSPRYAAAEFLWYMSGEESGRPMQAYAPQYERFLDESGIAHGAYGARWSRHDQINRVVDILTKKPDSRQAVITCWDAGTDLGPAVTGQYRDLPCTLSLQFLLRGGALHLVTTMRSNDVWLGMPYDVFCFTTLQRLIAGVLRVSPGYYVHNVGSLHLYRRDVEKATKALSVSGEAGQPSWPMKFSFLDRRDAQARIVHATILEKRMRDGEPINPELWKYCETDDGLTAMVSACGSRWGVPMPSWSDPRIVEKCKGEVTR